MKETTRQLILLIGLISFLTSGLVTLNMIRTSSADTPDPENQTQNRTQVPVSNNGTGKENTSNATKGLIAQSINGLNALMQDFQTGMDLVEGSS
ncbi:MAG: hypothetical protein ABEJ36_02585 [Candidatus Nanosalina sp.]